jgi:hypothetical protein
MKFKIGDRVIFTEDISWYDGKYHKPNKDSKPATIVTEFNHSNGYYTIHLVNEDGSLSDEYPGKFQATFNEIELDIEYYRNNKLKEIGI